ncbi:MAG TPA: PAS domain S-box protein [Leptolyngbyaceae cyanobacterium M33_DOE_097]|uniref:histidine kinase n=1 Tax=Oscillatoriales cyanobacterium SpSt-418 TaxID=2282169 RepID=A0A7C3KCL9_9CYAN|nr:PAS domain S-box protein [Leptolyngbyaceae cyanobacterium M33_DOE_097]
MTDNTRAISESWLIGNCEIKEFLRSHFAHTSDITDAARVEVSFSLKTALNILLSVNCPMLLVWGNDLALFYNDAGSEALSQNNALIDFGQSIQLCLDERWQQVRSLVEQVFTTGEPLQIETNLFSLELVNHPKDRDYIWCYSPFWSETGQVNGVFVTSQANQGMRAKISPLSAAQTAVRSDDDPLLRQAKAALRESEARFQAFMSYSPAAAWVASQDGKILYLSPTYSQMFQLPQQEVIGKSIYEVYSAEFAEPFLENNRRVIETGQVVEAVETAPRSDGSIGSFLVYKFPITQEASQEKLLGGVAIDITARVQMQEALRQREEELRLITDALPVLLAYVDKDHYYRFNNQAYEVWFGKPLSEFTGKHVRDVLGEAAYAAVLPYIEQALASQRVTYESQISYFDGSLRYICADYIPRINDQGEIEGYFSLVSDISDRKQTEIALSESEARLRLAMEGAQMGTWDLDLTTGKAIWSELHFTILGYQPVATGEATETMWRNRIHPEDVERVMQIWHQSQQEHLSYRCEYRVVRADNGQTAWIATLGSFTYDTQGQPIRSIGILFDITDRKQVEAARRQAETDLRDTHIQLEAALAAGSIYTWQWNIPSDRVVTNRNFARLFGVDPEGATTGLPIGLFLNAIHPDDRFRVTTEIQHAIRTGNAAVSEFRIINIKGEERWVIARGRVEYDANGNPVAFPGALADISERKQTEAALRESEDRFRQMTDTTPMLVWMSGTDQCCTYFNQTWLKFTGRTLEQEQGNGWVAGIHPEDVQTYLDTYTAAFEARRAFEIEYRHRRFDGEYRWVFSTGVPRFAPTGEFLGYIGSCFDIHGRKQAEASLQESEARFRMLADNISQFAWMADADGWVFWYNRRWFEYTGTTLEEMQSTGWQQTLHPDHRDRVVQYFNHCLQTGHAWEDIFPLRGQDGIYRWFLSRAQPIRDTTGAISRWFGTNTDITEQRQIEEALRNSEECLRSFVEANVVGIVFCDVYGGIHDANDELLRIIGYTREDLELGRIRWTDITPPEYLPIDEQMITEARETTGASAPYEKEYLRKDGSRVPVLVGFSLVGKAMEEAVAFILDLSDRKRAEAAIRQSEDRLRIAIESAQLGTWDLNPSTNELTWDIGCKTMFGLPPDAETNLDVFFQSLHPDDVDRVERVVQHALNPESGGIYDIEYRAIGIQDGIERWIKARGQAYFGSTGKPLRFTGTVLDITEQKRAEAEREQLLHREQAAREAAEKANRIKDEFLAVLSHELRSPLNPILGWSRLLQKGKLNPAKSQKALETIERNAQLQAELIEDLLDVSRILQGKLSLAIGPVNLAATIQAAIETVRLAAEAKSIQIETKLDPKIGLVLGDSTRLQQVVWNLVSNGVKFTPAGGRVEVCLEQIRSWEGGAGSESGSAPPDVQTSSAPQPYTYAQITVNDTGKGIDPDFLPHVFDYFRQEDGATTRKFGGLGLGLAIVRHLVELHGGTIRADSPGEGLGASFTVRLPLLREDEAGRSLDDTLLNFPSSHPLSNLRILVVDDDTDTRELLVFLLEQAGASVVSVASAREAIRTILQTKPLFDLLISDIGMPEMDGYMLMQQVRSLRIDQGGKVPAISLTAYAGEIDYQQAMAAGFQKHIPKPVKPDALIRAIAQVLTETV